MIDTTLPVTGEATASPGVLWPPKGQGSGNTSPDPEITGPLSANLRAERLGPGQGHIYTPTVECGNASGNTATRTVDVFVSHDRR